MYKPLTITVEILLIKTMFLPRRSPSWTELNSLLRTSGPDDLEALCFHNLNDEPNSRVRFIIFSIKRQSRGKRDPRANGTSACGNEESLALVECVTISPVENQQWDNSPSSLENIPSMPWKQSFLRFGRCLCLHRCPTSFLISTWESRLLSCCIHRRFAVTF